MTIPEDLKEEYEVANRFTPHIARLIERIARLEAENAELRKATEYFHGSVCDECLSTIVGLKQRAETAEAKLKGYTYDDCSKADADAAEQYAVAYVCQVGVSKESMIDAVSTLRAQVMTYEAALAEREKECQSLSEMAEAHEQKFKDCPHTIAVGEEASLCGCSYDRRSDICFVHLPLVKELRATLAERDKEIERLNKPCTNCETTKQVAHVIIQREAKTTESLRSRLATAREGITAALSDLSSHNFGCHTACDTLVAALAATEDLDTTNGGGK